MPTGPYAIALQFFSSDGLPESLALVTRPFGDLAHFLADDLPENDDTATALSKLLEARNAALASARTETLAGGG